MTENEEQKSTQEAGIWDKLDSFADRIQLQLPTGSNRFHTGASKVTTLCMLGIVLTYSIFKFQDSTQNNDARHTHRSVPKHFLDTDVFNADKFEGLQLAFGLATFDSNYDDLTEEPEYGQLKLYNKRWSKDTDDPDNIGVLFEEIPMRRCTPEELGMGPLGYDDPSAKFYPVNEDQKHWHDMYWQRLYCVDQKLTVHGDYQSVDISHLAVHLERCNSEVRQCKSEL